VALGIGREAVEEALADLREAAARPGGIPDGPPQWVLADAATEVEAARLATLRAARSLAARSGSAAARTAVLLAAGAAERAVDAALRILGPGAYRRGTVLERLTRDAKALGLVLGSIDAERMALADEILPG
jgi:alkylation response protein AidB-like acyl-CoA dehydrogenase